MILFIFLLLGALLTSSAQVQAYTVSNLQPCDLQDCLYRWELYPIFASDENFEFEEANATVTIFDTKYQSTFYLALDGSWSTPTLRYEPPKTLPGDSYCIQIIGADKSIACRNPGNVSDIRESGTYCYDTEVYPSYYSYSILQFEVILYFKLNYTVQLDSGPLDFAFDCNSYTHECTLSDVNATMPYLELWPLFDAWVYFTSIDFSTVTNKKLVVPNSPIFPYVPLSPDTLMVDLSAQLDGIYSVPDCYDTEGDRAWQNPARNILPPSLTVNLATIGLNVSTAYVSYLAGTTQLQLLIEGSVGTTSLADLIMYIPKRDFTP